MNGQKPIDPASCFACWEQPSNRPFDPRHNLRNTTFRIHDSHHKRSEGPGGFLRRIPRGVVWSGGRVSRSTTGPPPVGSASASLDQREWGLARMLPPARAVGLADPGGCVSSALYDEGLGGRIQAGQRRCELVGGLGFEPRLTGPEPVVLPLDDPPKPAGNIRARGAGSIRPESSAARRRDGGAFARDRAPLASRRWAGSRSRR